MCSFRNFLADEAGATAIEYALLSMLIALPIITVIANLGTQLSGEFSQVSAGFK